MKNFLYIALGFVALILIIIFVPGIFLQKEISISRTQIIMAPANKVFEQVSSFRNWRNWSPWYRLDTNMTLTFSGEDCKMGSTYHWKSKNENLGEREFVLTGISGTQMDFEIDYSKAENRIAVCTIQVEDSAGMSKMVWKYHIKIPYPWNSLILFVNLDRFLGTDFETGMRNIKDLLETHTAVQVKEVSYPVHIFQGIRKTLAWADLADFFSLSYSTLGKLVGMKVTGPPVGIYYAWDTVNKYADIAAAYTVADSSVKGKGIKIIRVDACKALMAVQEGGYSNSYIVHNLLKNELKARGLNYSLIIEEYVKGQAQVADSNLWVTNVYYLIK